MYSTRPGQFRMVLAGLEHNKVAGTALKSYNGQ